MHIDWVTIVVLIYLHVDMCEILETVGNWGAEWKMINHAGTWLRNGTFLFVIWKFTVQRVHKRDFFSPLQRTIVPTAFGGSQNSSTNGSNYVTGLGAPFHSFIDTRQHSSPKELAGYLKQLSDSPERYTEYFWWKQYYEILRP